MASPCVAALHPPGGLDLSTVVCMPQDPIDDLLSTPDGTVSPFDPLEGAVPKDIAAATFGAMRDDALGRLDRHLKIHGPDGDTVGLTRRRMHVQQAIDALEWIATQPGATVTLGCYPVDLAAENEYFDQMLIRFPELADVGDDELFMPRGADAQQFREELDQQISDLQDNPPDETKE